MALKWNYDITTHAMIADEHRLMDSNRTLCGNTPLYYSGLMAWKQMAGLGHLSLVKPHWVAPPSPSFPLSAF